MILYHGTNKVIKEIDIRKGKLRTDFGLGFYLGNDYNMAVKWSKFKGSLDGKATIMKYDVNNAILSDQSLNPKRFPDVAEITWLDFVSTNRRRNAAGMKGKEPRHNYGVVSGLIADDRADKVVEAYMKGDITAEQALHEIRTFHKCFQLSIHDQRALMYISRSVQYRQLGSSGWGSWINIIV